MSYFIFKGIDSRTFGVTSKSAFPPIAERVFKTTEIPGRAEPLNRLEVMRKNSKLAFTVSVLDLSRLTEINAWLQGEGGVIEYAINKFMHENDNLFSTAPYA